MHFKKNGNSNEISETFTVKCENYMKTVEKELSYDIIILQFFARVMKIEFPW